jgi:hypothetical protein
VGKNAQAGDHQRMPKTCDLSQNSSRRVVLHSSTLARVLESWIDINAPVSDVWDALVDVESWGKWNSFIPVVEGAVQVGSTIKIRVVSPGMKEMNFEPTVYAIERHRRISWGGGFLLFVYKGVHEIILEEIDQDTTRFRQIERFQGPIVLFMSNMIRQTAIGYLNMNEELKHYLEHG